MDDYESLGPVSDEVRDFLAEQPQLLPALAEAPREIRRLFPDAVLSLTVEQDVDLGPQPGILVLARTKAPSRARIDGMLKLRRGWWYDLERKHGNDIRLAIRSQ